MKTETMPSDDQMQPLNFRCDRSALDELVRVGAQEMLAAALEAEVSDYIERHSKQRDAAGRRLVVRNGYGHCRQILTGAGPLDVRQPRVNDRRDEHHFSSSILPPYLRKSPTIEALIPVLYLKGISTGQFGEALSAILGPDAAGLSASSVTELIKTWESEYESWNQRDLSSKRYVYWWADGIYFKVRLSDDERVCMLVIMGTLEDGRKELVGILSGHRESKLSWQDLLRSLKQRGMAEGPKLATGDGALGFWAALQEEFPQAREQRCWVHKTANILDKMPKSIQERAKERIHDIYLAPTKAAAEEAFDEFVYLFDAKYPRACECLRKDREVLLTFYDFPAEHWQHVRTTNPIESTFATVRHRTKRTKGRGTRAATCAMVFKLCMEAQTKWRRLNGYALIPKLFQGIRFVDGEEVKEPIEKAG